MMHKKIVYIVLLFFASCQLFAAEKIPKKIKKTLQKGIIEQTEWAINQQPITVTASFSERSAGGIHDFFSEGDYWWQNPDDPTAPYIQRDGMTNPDNFVAHRKAMISFSQIVGSLASVYLITNNEKYVKAAFRHLNAWFINPETIMNPNLLYAQAIKGRVTGRGIGIIDMIQMIEVAQSLKILQKAPSAEQADVHKIKNWFSKYLDWVTTHQYGIDEREAKNNHATCWVMQVAVFAKLTDNQTLIDYCKNRFKTVLLANQMEKDGSFPLELKRTKPYGYALFNLDAMATIAHVLSDSNENFWNFSLPDGRKLNNAVDFMLPYVKDKSTWPYPKDVMYWDQWPVAQPFLLFAYLQTGKSKYFKTWKSLNHFPNNAEVIRNLPIRNPLIWLF